MVISTNAGLRWTRCPTVDDRVRTGRNSTRTPFGSRLGLLSAILAGLALSGCAGKPSPLGEASRSLDVDGVVRVIVADWDDLDAAVEVALTRCELASLDRDTSTRAIERQDGYSDQGYPDEVETVLTWTLSTRDGRPGVLEATRSIVDASGLGRDNEITLRVRIGTFGTPSEEACVSDEVTARLEALRGLTVAPLDGS
ncbi:MAG: hypothetical protein AAGI53_06450 [Planctomycetota bacterium]